MRLFGLLLYCVTLLSAQALPTREELDEKFWKLQNQTAQHSALAEDLRNDLVKQLSQALEAAKASGNLAQAAKLSEALTSLSSKAPISTPPDVPQEAAKANAGAKAAGTNSTAPSSVVWGYMLLRFAISNRSLDEVEQLNTAGKRGYELVSVVQAGNERLFYLKRRVQ
jgi:hypothetical protein